MSPSTATLFLCGDVMLGRGVDQILQHSCDPRLEEGYMKDARGYVELAEEKSGLFPRRAGPDYVWGDALSVLSEEAPDARVINLETSVTTSEERWPAKGIHYRMHPGNVEVLRAAAVDVCVLANNHVLDHGRAGLDETLRTLGAARLRSAGAGRDAAEALRPAVVPLGSGGRLLVFAAGTESSGIPREWAATAERSGVALVAEASEPEARALAARVGAAKQPGDLAVVSIHWGSNWGYRIPREQVRFAHALIDGGVDLVHGHSSHHPRPLELYRGHLVLYGCGDFLNDYEGIEGHGPYRPELAAMYFPRLSRDDGTLSELRMVPVRVRRFRLERAPEEAGWMAGVLDVESAEFNTHVSAGAGGVLGVEVTPR